MALIELGGATFNNGEVALVVHADAVTGIVADVTVTNTGTASVVATYTPAAGSPISHTFPPGTTVWLVPTLANLVLDPTSNFDLPAGASFATALT